MTEPLKYPHDGTTKFLNLRDDPIFRIDPAGRRSAAQQLASPMRETRAIANPDFNLTAPNNIFMRPSK